MTSPLDRLPSLSWTREAARPGARPAFGAKMPDVLGGSALARAQGSFAAAFTAEWAFTVGVALAGQLPHALVYALAVVSTIAFTPFRATHSALVPMLCRTTDELTMA